ncbi:MAG: alpha/beta hydrolase-fold protein [Bacteroidota bacterium]|nr:alpha/beta hydrolase-fold protein [Bacteroidota bacterium]
MGEETMAIEEKIFTTVEIEQLSVHSDYLEREVIVDVYLPKNKETTAKVSLLLVNDGQDLVTMSFGAILDRLFFFGHIEPLICAAIHCSEDRINEYGTVCRTDYKGRGAKAGLYNKFIFDELLPFLKKQLKIASFKDKSFAGFSLGGLSALDIVWNRPDEFAKVGVFSASLWWRRKGYEEQGYNWEKDRIMHLQVQKGRCFPWLQFFFECGLLDETADRNNNGIIDSIEDTTDLINDLKAIGYTDEHIHYLELEDGEHNIATWARSFPAFLKWGWGAQ